MMSSCRFFRYDLSTHPVNTHPPSIHPAEHSLSIHLVNTHLVNTSSQVLNTVCQYTLSTHTIHAPCTHSKQALSKPTLSYTMTYSIILYDTPYNTSCTTPSDIHSCILLSYAARYGIFSNVRVNIFVSPVVPTWSIPIYEISKPICHYGNLIISLLYLDYSKRYTKEW